MTLNPSGEWLVVGGVDSNLIYRNGVAEYELYFFQRNGTTYTRRRPALASGVYMAGKHALNKNK